jgi:myo-inositol-1(or 4)-monophosphatase
MDHASEELIVRAIRREFPDHGVLAEERGASGESPCRWIIDPVDGTTNYAHGLPLWAVTLALEVRGELVAGVTYAPALRDLFWASKGRGAWRNGRRIRVSRTNDLGEALLVTGFPYDLKHRTQQLRLFSAFIPKAQAIRRCGAASLDLAWTACGAFDAFWEFRLGPWDMAAGVVLLREAGAKATTYAGLPADLPTAELVAANPVLHRQILAVIRKTRLS